MKHAALVTLIWAATIAVVCVRVALSLAETLGG